MTRVSALRKSHHELYWRMALGLFVAWLLFSGNAPAQEATGLAISPATEDSEENDAYRLNLESFDKVWQTVRDRSWDPDFDVPGWEAQRETLRPQLTPDSSIQEVRELMTEMLEWLDQSHFGILPADLYEGWDEDDDEDVDQDENTKCHLGIKVRLVDEQLVVSRVIPDSDAETQGVRAGWQLTKVKGKSVAEFLDGLREALAQRSQRDLPMTAAYAVDSRISGRRGSKIKCEFVDQDGVTQRLTIKLSALPGESVTIANLPPMVVDHQARELDGSIAYFSFDGFFAPVQVMGDLKKAIEIARPGKGLIIDLRGNGGGLAGMTMGVGNLIANEDEEQFLGTLKTRDTTLRFVLIPNVDPYNGPVAVLVDECSASAAEILAGGLQAIGRAKLFGTRTAGAALPSIVEDLPNGDRFQFAFASYIDSRERCIEGAGVTPDVLVPLTQEDLLEGKDRVLETAIDWIKQQSAAH